MSQPSLQDLLNPFDPTGYPSMSGAQILQFLTGTSPFNDKGMCILNSDINGTPQVPAANTTVKWQNYLWIRISPTNGSLTVYAWNPNIATDPTFLNWQSINLSAFGAGSIPGSALMTNSVLASAIINLAWSQLVGVPTTFAPGGVAGGVLAGTYPNPSFASFSITGSQIAIGTILGGDGVTGTSNIGAQTVTMTNLKGDGVAFDMLRVKNVAGYLAVEWFTPPSILLGGAAHTGNNFEAGLGANPLKPLIANAAGTDYTWAAHQVLQMTFSRSSATQHITGTTLAITGTAPTTGNMVLFNWNGTGGAFSITPLSASSKFFIEISVPLTFSTVTHATMAIFCGTTLVAASVYAEATGAPSTTLHLQGEFDSVSLTALNFYIYLAPASGDLYINETATPTAFLAGNSAAFVKITEYLP